MSPTIGLTGDVMLGRKVDERQRHRAVTAVWGDVLEDLRSLDGLAINLECCLSDRGRPWRRTHRPFHFRADPDWALPALREAGVDHCSLVNNHVLDFEEVALRDTLSNLDRANVAYSGAGNSKSDAIQPASVEIGGVDVTFVSMTDNTSEYAATETGPGTAWIEIDVDAEATRSAVRTALDRARANDPDLLVASLHWGPNMVEEPPPEYRTFGRWLVDEGVDVVQGHSAHVFQGVEVYDGALILYDTGDFVDDYAVDDELRNDRGFLFELSVDDSGRLRSLELLPTEILNCSVTRADPGVAEWSRDRMRELSAPFGTEFERRGSRLVLPLDGRPVGSYPRN